MDEVRSRSQFLSTTERLFVLSWALAPPAMTAANRKLDRPLTMILKRPFFRREVFTCFAVQKQILNLTSLKPNDLNETIP